MRDGHRKEANNQIILDDRSRVDEKETIMEDEKTERQRVTLLIECRKGQ